jgi:hypothetical protein
MRERFSHGFWTDWQMANACARGDKDRVSDGGRDRGCRRFSKANWRFRAWQKFDLDFGYAAHAQQRICIEIRILRLAFHELRTLVQSHAQFPQRRALNLCRGAVRMNNRASVNDKG